MITLAVFDFPEPDFPVINPRPVRMECIGKVTPSSVIVINFFDEGIET